MLTKPVGSRAKRVTAVTGARHRPTVHYAVSRRIKTDLSVSVRPEIASEQLDRCALHAETRAIPVEVCREPRDLSWVRRSTLWATASIPGFETKDAEVHP